MKRTFKTLAVLTGGLTAFALFFTIVVYNAAAAPTADQFLLRVDVKDSAGTHVQVSAPLSLLATLYDVFPKEIKAKCEEVNLTPDKVLHEIETLEGDDIVRIEGKDNIRIWAEPVTEQTRRSLGFLSIQVIEPGEDGNKVNVKVPRGLIQMAGEVISQLQISDALAEEFLDYKPGDVKFLKEDAGEQASE